MISIIIPTYNERDNIIALVNNIGKNLLKTKNKFEIIIVDDDSPDGTYIEAFENFQKNNNIRLFLRKNEHELGTAILFGIKKAKGNIIVGMDADFNHPPEALIRLINELKNYDLVIGSRFIKGGGMEDKIRYIFTYIFNLFLRHILRFPTMDNMSGFYAINKKKLIKLPIDKIYQGYGEYHLRLVYIAYKFRLKIKEIPVFYQKRLRGESKSSFLKMFFRYLLVSFDLKLGNGKI